MNANIKVIRERRLTDDFWLVNVKVVDPTTRRKLGTLQLREVHADIHYGGRQKPMAIRLWTTLLDEMEHPACALVEFYATRWEEELFFRELKSQLHGRDNLLDAQTPETAAQEVLAMLLAASLVAMQREAVQATRMWRSCASAWPRYCTRPQPFASCWRWERTSSAPSPWGNGSNAYSTTWQPAL